MIEKKFNPVEKNLYMSFFTDQNSILINNGELKKVLESSIKESEAHILKSVNQTFEPHGFSMVWILEESHAATHTSPEYNFGSFTLSTCGQTHPFRAVWPLIKSVNPLAGIIRYEKGGMDLKDTKHVFPDTLDDLIKRYEKQFKNINQDYIIIGTELEKENFKLIYYRKGEMDQNILYHLAKNDLTKYKTIQ